MAKDYWIDCNKLKKILREHGKTLPQASKEMGHNGTYLNHIRHRNGKTNQSTILMLKHLYGIEYADIEQKPEQLELQFDITPDSDFAVCNNISAYESNTLYEVIKKAMYDALCEWSKEANL